MRFLIYGSEEYYRLKDEADSIYYNCENALTMAEREYWIKLSNRLSDEIHSKYGFADHEAERLIKEYYLDRQDTANTDNVKKKKKLFNPKSHAKYCFRKRSTSLSRILKQFRNVLTFTGQPK